MTDLPPSTGHIVFDRFDCTDERRREALFALGNGVLSWRASAPEAAAAGGSHCHYGGLYRAGWYDEAPRRVNGREVRMAALVNLPDPFGLSLSLDDGASWFCLERVRLHRYRQCLDHERGLLTRSLDFELCGQRVSLDEERLLSLAEPDLAVLRWHLRLPPGVRRVRLRATLDGGVADALVERDRAYEGRRLLDVGGEIEADGRAALSAHLADRRRRVVVAVETRLPGREADWRSERSGERLVQETDCTPGDDGQLIVEKRVRVRVDDELPGTDADARRLLLEALPAARYEALRHAHCAAWQALWPRLGLRSPDAELECTLRFHAWHLLQTVSPHSPASDQGFPPRGWQEGYFGQVFWDEIFVYPFLASRFPELAHGLLGYRHRRLDAARRLARGAGLRGAMFPWRSAASGQEETPPFQFNPLSGRWMPDHTALQRHIGAAIAFDAWSLWLATGDQGLLAGQAGELILEIARFWASLARLDAAGERFVICGVIGPDEYHNAYPGAAEPGLDNNAYTNLMAAWTLCRALEVLQRLPPADAEALRARLGVTGEELAYWDTVSRRLYLPLREDGVLSQFDGFDALAEPPPDWLNDGRPRLDWMLEAQHDSSDNYRLTKQADVLMLLYLFTPEQLCELAARLGYRMSVEDVQRTARHHLANVTHESSLSLAVCAGALARVDPDESWRHFHRCLRVDLDAPPGSGTTEGVHLGAMAGSLDVLQRHYLGIRPTPDGLRLDPAPPAALPDVTLAVQFRGARLRVALEGERLRVEADAGNPQPCPIAYPGGACRLAPGADIQVPVVR
ncbi:glycosyl hydrolase family 65 protein [Stutzerimonas azotifigens]|uniref:glycosyl hydrolase family 65 protein n=1 Tax=Stutzerimonas azotifigens TaxID=291995 RepID=UPI0004113DF3|nr:glycosyl hydrolase family 65 protein [Stutzerimonas azotifigens]